MADGKSIATPLDARTSLPKLSHVEEYEEHLHNAERSAPRNGGLLMYAMMATRVDLTFAVNVVSQFLFKPGSIHRMAVKQIMRYLKGILDLKLHIH